MTPMKEKNKTVTTVTAIKAAHNCFSLKVMILSIDKFTFVISFTYLSTGWRKGLGVGFVGMFTN